MKKHPFQVDQCVSHGKAAASAVLKKHPFWLIINNSVYYHIKLWTVCKSNEYNTFHDLRPCSGTLLLCRHISSGENLYFLVSCASCNLTLIKVLVATIDAQWEGMGDVGLARYEPALLPPMPDHKGFKLQLLVNFHKFSTLRVNTVPGPVYRQFGFMS